jgi:ribonuclease Y
MIYDFPDYLNKKMTEMSRSSIVLFSILLFFIFYLITKTFRKRRIREAINKLFEKKENKEELRKRENLEIFQKQIINDSENLKLNEKKLQLEEKRIINLSEQLFKKEELFLQQLSLISQREKKLREETEYLEKVRVKIIDELGKIIPISRDEAKKNLFMLLKEEVDEEMNLYKDSRLKFTDEQIKSRSIEIMCFAMEKYSANLSINRTTNFVRVEDKQIVSKIIGKEGRNINAFRRTTGVDLIIDKEKDDTVIQVSSFNSLRREIAVQTLKLLSKSEKISPSQIEKIYKEVSSGIKKITLKTGQSILKKLEINGVHDELVEYIGKLKYRTSYGQNVLEHSYEVAHFMGNIAAELGLDVILARRVGLLHDIGKSVEDEEGYSHVLSGINIAKKFEEPEEVLNAIASHHNDFPANNVYSLMILAADKLSAARPGARGQQLEAYIERMNNLEKIANEFQGIKKTYAFQAGREV